jgi:microcin C transport system substrate-binding protein
MTIERKDFASWMRDMDAFNFDMTWAAWGGSLFRDPESMWLSSEADRPSGNNITGFKDPQVDALIERQKTLFSITERNAICRDIDGRIAAAVPYVLLWNTEATRLLHWDTFGMPDTVLSKFGDERSLLGYWWYDTDSASELRAAMAAGDVLPQRRFLLILPLCSTCREARGLRLERPRLARLDSSPLTPFGLHVSPFNLTAL